MSHQVHEAEVVNVRIVDQTVARLGGQSHKILDILQQLQRHYGYLPRPALERLCQISEITPAAVAGVSTFYSQFRHKPAGKHTIGVCIGTACHVKGAQPVYEGFKRALNIGPDDDTDQQKNFTVEKVACLGCCTLAPAVQIGEVTYGHVTAETAGEVVEDFLRYLEQQKRQGKKDSPAVDRGRVVPEIRVSLDSCCVARGCGGVFKAVEDVLRQTGIEARIKPVGCVGICDETPMVEIAFPDGRSFVYARIEPGDVKGVLSRHFKIPGIGKRVCEGVTHLLDTLVSNNGQSSVTRHLLDFRDSQVAAYMGAQKQIATLGCAVEDPADIQAYKASGGFESLGRCLREFESAKTIELMEQSGLRGRGGAGFSTAGKWRLVAQQRSEQKYIICNGDEGDPGAFMDRMLLESCPYRIIEGMVIAAHAVGASRGYLYIRAEYPVALKRMREALDICREHGFIGDDILGSGFSLELEIKEGAGAFVCGEETALIAAIEGGRGMPRVRPPYPAQRGLWGKPTLVNNVETYANVPWIIYNGPGALAQLGTEKSKGTKVFSLAGKIARGALIEVPMGITLKEIVEKIGGGVPGGKELKAVQVGGPSGGCVPARLGYTAVDYEDLTKAGVIMGSGGLVVLDEEDCMVDIARYFLEFTQDESCGKCTFCRIGTRRMLDILERICEGHGKNGDIEKLEQLGSMVGQGSLCGLGRTAPTPVLSTIKHFRDEYQAHIDGRCPAGKCKALIEYVVTEDCIGCTVCAQSCPADAIEFRPYQQHEIDSEKCTRCDVCRGACPSKAIVIR